MSDLRTYKLDVPPTADKHTKDVINQLNKILPKIKQQLDTTTTAVSANQAGLAAAQAQLAKLTPAALQTLIQQLLQNSGSA